MKILMILRQPEDGFEEEDIASLLNIGTFRRFFNFYFGLEESVVCGIYHYELSNEPDQNFWVVVEETEENGKEEDDNGA